MAKAALGQKRVCLNCGARFYDLNRLPITCPSCNTSFEPEAFLRPRRSRPAETQKPARPTAVTTDLDSEAEADDVLPADEDAEDADADGDAEEEEILEDASELGEDEDDMAEVIENVDSKEKEP